LLKNKWDAFNIHKIIIPAYYSGDSKLIFSLLLYTVICLYMKCSFLKVMLLELELFRNVNVGNVHKMVYLIHLEKKNNALLLKH